MEATSSKTGALAAEIQRAIEVLPASHRIEPQDGELVDNPRDGYIRLQDWAFIQGFAFVKESTRAERWVLHCIHHHDTTRDYRKTEEKDRKRAWTSIHAMGYRFSMYISYRKKINNWAIGYTHREHNHPMNPDPFSCIIHRSRRCGHDKAMELARGLRGEVSYKKAKAIFQNHDLNIELKEYYNLTRREATKKLNSQERLRLLPKFPSPTPRQSGRTRKPTKKLESQKRREIEDQSKPKRQKVRRSKIDVTSQLKEYLGSDVELYM